MGNYAKSPSSAGSSDYQNRANETRTVLTQYAIVPLNNALVQDVQHSVNGFDQWIREISGGHLSLSDLQTIAAGLPILGNLIAASDVVVGLYEMSQKQQPAGFVEWFGIGVDAIGIIPIPPAMAPLRLTMRPIVGMVRQAVVRNKGQIGDAVLTVIANHILSDYRVAHTIEKAVEDFQSMLGEAIKAVADFLGKLVSEFSTFLKQLATGTLGKYRAVAKGSRYQQGKNLRSAAQEKAGLFSSLLEIHAKARNAVINSITQLALSQDLKNQLIGIANYLDKTIAVNIKSKIMALADAKLENSIASLITKLLTAIRNKRKRGQAAGAALQGKNGQVKYQVPQGRVEKQRRLAPVKQSPNACKLCPAKAGSGKSIGFGLGEESFTHTDFILPGVMPLSWSRTYNSRLASFDNASQGARWLTPFHIRFDLVDDSLRYTDAQGRELSYPLLQPGEHHRDRSEEITLSRLDDSVLTVTRGHELIEAYERHGERFLLAMLRDRSGNQVVLDYDAQGRLSRLRNNENPWVLVQHDTAGRITNLTLSGSATGEPPRQLAEYRYNEQGDLISATDEHGHTREYTYQHHLITRYTDRTGRGINLEWDGADATARAIREYADDGSDELKLEYVTDLRLTITTDALGHETYYYCDDSGYPYRTIHADGKEEWMYRDDFKNLTKHIHSDGTQDRYVYDDRDNLIEHIRTDASTIQMKYDAKDQLIEIIDPLGYAWRREYDDKGNVAKEIDPKNHETTYAYNAQGLLTKIKDAKGGTKQLAYSPAGQLTSYTDCSGKTSSWQYDALGRLISAQDAAGNITEYRYGKNGYLALVQQPDGTQIKLEHDAEGRLLTHLDELDRATRYAYDQAGRISGRIDALDQQLGYRYDKLGQLVTLINENGDSYRFAYDPVGRLLEETDFGGLRTAYDYDAGSGTLQAVDEAGMRTTLVFDAARRLVGRDAGQSRERFQYDPLGRLAQAKNRYSTARFNYDEVSNLIHEQQLYSLFGLQRDYQWQHEYDELGNRIASVRPDGNRIDWLTYGSGHVHGVLWNGEELASFERDDLHRETARALANRLNATTQYDALGRILHQQLSGATQHQRQYRYDPVGQLLNIRDSRSGDTNYRYDPVGRLLAAVSPQGTEAFAFDPASNLVDSARSDNTLPAGLPKITGNLLRDYAGTHFDYDARGNLTRKTRNGLTQQFSWDGFNRLIAAETATGKTEYAYDVFGRRIAKKTEHGTTLFLWDGDVLESEYDGATQRHYLFEAGSFVPLAQVAQRAGAEHKAYYHVDHLGTPQLLTDDTGEIAWSAEYKAWGEAREAISDAAKAAGIQNPLRFQGQYADEETGLHYNRHRYYDPEIGRFASRDPIGLLGGLNTHAYAPNSTEWIDPAGLARKQKQSQALGKAATGCDTWPGKQAHHVIPEELENHAVLRNIGFKMNSASNAIMLPSTPNGYMSTHSGYHSAYNRAVEAELDHIGKKYPNSADQERAVKELQRNLDSALRKNKLPLYKTSCGQKTGLKDGDWDRYIRSSRRY
ncbi:RHS repeat-associated core domain-containing protein [Chitinolyticbacter meiyuanensis]|uniref:RHS repeat-associated core domain-containing protein n=1 Tax=Chitinolyticbacter meiyuanensis TaxID=682798 RepID=UPI0011E5A99B|nr:RHS repeat-associated core domain-containing protein [Chitinolyticbacter meiyuanensis]